MSKVYQEKSTGKFVMKTQEEYKGVSFSCKGSSRAGKMEAKKNWQKNLLKHQARIDGKIDVKIGKIKFKKALPEWYELYKKSDGRNSKTISTDLDTINQLCNSSLGKVDLCDIGSDDIQKYLYSLVNHSQSTIKKRWNMLQMFFRYWYPISDDNVMLRCNRPKSLIIIEEKLALTDEEMERLTVQLRQPYSPEFRGAERGYLNGEMLVVSMYQFLRPGELVELRRKDVDLERDILHIRRQYDELNREIRKPKYNSIREMPIAAESREILKNACIGKKPGDLLFSAGRLNGSTHDGHVLQNGLLRVVASACEICGLEKQTTHDLRHNGISRLVRFGVKPTSIQKWAGHKSLDVTLRIYFRQTDELDEDDASIMRKKSENKTVD